MNQNFSDRFDGFPAPGDAQQFAGLTGALDSSETPRERRRRLQRNTILGLAVLALLVLVAMIITRAVEITSV